MSSTRRHGLPLSIQVVSRCRRGSLFSAPIVMQLGGWKTERMMRRYAAVTDQTLRAAAEAASGNEPMSLTGAPAAPMSGR